MRFDSVLMLMPDRTDSQIAFQRSKSLFDADKEHIMFPYRFGSAFVLVGTQEVLAFPISKVP